MYNVISLFTGAGGLDLGLEAAGFSTRICVESNNDAVKTLRLNRGWAIIHQDIHNVSGKQILKISGLKKNNIDLLIGGPPCQPFSKSGYWKNGTTLRMSDPRASTIKAYIRILKETLPHAFILENVPGLVFQNKSEGFSYFMRQLKILNKECKTKYAVSWKVLNAADFGIPQIRERLFLVGHKEGVEFQFPNKTHSEVRGGILKPYLTAWDAIGDLENNFDPEEHKLTGRWSELISSIPEGQNYRWHTEEGGGDPIFKWRSRYWNFLLKLAKNKPSWTIQAQPGPATGPFHWNSRKLTSCELLRLQTFPKGYKLVGNKLSIQRQIGNAVPSALAEILGLAIRRQYFGEDVVQKATLIPKTRKQPKKYVGISA